MQILKDDTCGSLKMVIWSANVSYKRNGWY